MADRIDGETQRLAGLGPVQQAVQLTDRVCEAVQAAIINCGLPPGKQLTDRELAEALGVSRTPAREALNRLQSTGLVETNGRRGWRVADFTEGDVQELFELRRILEPVGLDHLRENPRSELIERFGSDFEGLPDPVPPEVYDTFLRADHAFHSKIVACSNNSRLVDIYGGVENQILRGRHYLSTHYWGRGQADIRTHRRIAQAITDHDFDTARDLLIDHLHNAERVMLEFLRLHVQAS